jgi:hypothetical protein
MNFANILNSIAETDPDVFERTSSRRRIIRNWMPKVAIATLPLALGSLFQKAYGKSNDGIVDTLKFALTLERLESAFYNTAIMPLTQSTLFAASRPQDLQAIQLIAANETAHRNFLEQTINALGGSSVDVPNAFDFTGGRGTYAGPFTDVFTNYVTFLSVSQSFEDLGVRAYKGAAPSLMSDNDVLTAALRIHSVEGRHAAKIRQMRTENGFATVKPWITQAINGIPNAAAQPPYAGENNTQQGGIELTGLSGLSANTVTEAFDEPLGKDAVISIISNFIKQ